MLRNYWQRDWQWTTHIHFSILNHLYLPLAYFCCLIILYMYMQYLIKSSIYFPLIPAIYFPSNIMYSLSWGHLVLPVCAWVRTIHWSAGSISRAMSLSKINWPLPQKPLTANSSAVSHETLWAPSMSILEFWPVLSDTSLVYTVTAAMISRVQ